MTRLARRLRRLALPAGLSLLLGCSGGPGTVEDEDTDTTPPATVTDLMALDVTSQSARLQWTAPADQRDDGAGGAVVAYDLRRSDALITEANFAQAATIGTPPAPLPAGQIQSLVVAGLVAGARHYFALRACDDRGNWSAVSDCPHADCPGTQVIVFPDPALEQAIRAHVGKPVGDLLSSDVDTITHFAAAAAGIDSLVGLEACLSLETASLGGNRIADLSPLRYLEHLVGLYLNSNRIDDLGPLVGLTSLQQLHLMWNPVTDLTPVSYLFSLRQLTLSGTMIANYAPLVGLQHLEDVYLGGMELETIDFVASLTHLRGLNLEINRIYSAEALRWLPALESLNLFQNLVVDLSPLAGLANLRDVNLRHNRVADVQALVDNPGLGAGDSVDLRENPLSAAALAVQIPALEARGVVVLR